MSINTLHKGDDDDDDDDNDNNNRPDVTLLYRADKGAAVIDTTVPLSTVYKPHTVKQHRCLRLAFETKKQWQLYSIILIPLAFVRYRGHHYRASLDSLYQYA